MISGTLKNIFSILSKKTIDVSIPIESLKKQVGGGLFDHDGQEDAQEFLGFLLQGLSQEQCIPQMSLFFRQNKEELNEENVASLLKNLRTRITTLSLLDRVFSFSVIIKRRCSNCFESRFKVQEEKWLPVYLEKTQSTSNTGTINSMEMIETGFREEIVHDLQCTICLKKSSHFSWTSLVTLPEVLIVQIKRFKFDEKTKTRVKLDTPVTLQRKINLTKFFSDEQPAPPEKANYYALTAVIHHYGTINTGHYFTYSSLCFSYLGLQ